ncbi:MAG: AbrB/MazE/SpoVT family DNA-binding domain-containing protein [Tannerellaceae bacterium]|jgi:antitoxin MazE|nr:AbrB/MazE/SpoVT family DNA-binding domain-containing protein [Tannerellaceae bacterium]
MKTSIIQIGNSKGLILPSEILRRLHLFLKTTVSVSVDGEKIIIKPEPRQGWAEAARLMNESGDDVLLIPAGLISTG